VAPQGAGRRSEWNPFGSSAVTHDLGALELRADDEADSKRQKSKAYCFPATGQCASNRL
jgi:hypothetical protein